MGDFSRVNIMRNLPTGRVPWEGLTKWNRDSGKRKMPFHYPLMEWHNRGDSGWVWGLRHNLPFHKPPLPTAHQGRLRKTCMRALAKSPIPLPPQQNGIPGEVLTGGCSVPVTPIWSQNRRASECSSWSVSELRW